MEHNKPKNDFLGMPLGTASNRLRKNILFQCVQRLGEDACFKCGDKIETVDDLSIEHKLPWLNISVELFWDLNNIAFSHLSCNRPHTPGGHTRRKIGPEGTAWCPDHEEFLPNTLFYRGSRWNGFDMYCKVHSEQRDSRKRRKRNGSMG